MAKLFRELRDPETGRWLPKEVWYRVRGAIAVVLSLTVLIGGGWFGYLSYPDGDGRIPMAAGGWPY